MLITGSELGAIEANFLHFPFLWPLVSMSALMEGLMRAPLTAVIFAFEVTQAPQAMAPALLATALCYAVKVLTVMRSILTEKVARLGHHIFYEYGVDSLESERVDHVMMKEPICIAGSMSTIGDSIAARFLPNGREKEGTAWCGSKCCCLRLGT